MSEKENNIVVIDGVGYDYDSLTPRIKSVLHHISDISRKIGETQMLLEQLSVGKDAFCAMLRNEMTEFNKQAEVELP